MNEHRTITRDSELDGEPIGEGFYYPGWRQVPSACFTKQFPSGMVRRVYTDDKGRALMTGWFRPEAYSV